MVTYTRAEQQVHERLRAIGPHPAWQVVAPPVLDSDLVATPVTMAASGKVSPLQFHGDPAWSNPKLVTIYMGGNYWGDRARHDRFLYEMMQGGYLDSLKPFGFKAGQWYGSFDGPAPGREMYDSEVQKLLSDWLATSPAGVLLSQPETLYMMFWPDGYKVTFDGGTDSNCTSFCGYHSNIQHPTLGQFAYSLQFCPHCAGCNQGTTDADYAAADQMVSSHEGTETFTDAFGRGWYNDKTGMEGGDECAWVKKAFGPWTVQGYPSRSWRNVAGRYHKIAASSGAPVEVAA